MVLWNAANVLQLSVTVKHVPQRSVLNVKMDMLLMMTVIASLVLFLVVVKHVPKTIA